MVHDVSLVLSLVVNFDKLKKWLTILTYDWLCMPTGNIVPLDSILKIEQL